MKKLLLIIIFIFHLSINAIGKTDYSRKADSLLYGIHLLDKVSIKKNHKILLKSYDVTSDKDGQYISYQDSIEYKRRNDYRDSLKSIITDYKHKKISASYLLNLGNRYYALRGKILDVKDRVIRYTEDSILSSLAIDCYLKAYRTTSDCSIKHDALNKLGGVFHLEQRDYEALLLFKYAQSFNSNNLQHKVESLWGIIRSMYPGDKQLDKDVAKKLLPIYVEFVQLYIKYFPDNIDTIILILSELGYVSKIAGDISYVEYCKMAISVANKYDKGALIFLKNIISTIGYYQSPNIILGDYYSTIGNYGKALDLYRSSLIIEEDKFAKVTPENVFEFLNEDIGSTIYKFTSSYPIHLCKMGSLHYKMGTDLYNKYLTEAYYYSLKRCLFIFHNDVEEIRNHNYGILKFPLISQYNNTDARWEYNAALFVKGITNNVDIDLKRIHTNADGTLSGNYQMYVSCLQSYQKMPNAYNKNRLHQCEVTLMKGTMLRDFLKPLQFIYMDVHKAIKSKNFCAVEFVAAPKLDEAEDTYYALILTPETITPIRVELGKESDFANFLMMSPNNRRLIKSDLHLAEFYKTGYELVWSKIEHYFKKGDNVYFSPTGLLHQINLEILKDTNGLPVNEKYNLYRLSSTRELCIEKEKAPITSAALYGDLIYDVVPSAMVIQSRAYVTDNNYIAARGFIKGTDTIKRTDLNRLFGTGKEINRIKSTLLSQGVKTKIYTLEGGNEESFKSLSGKGISIIHLATHGFFYKNNEVQDKPFYERMEIDKYKSDNPLKRSGVFLAGAKNAWLGKSIPNCVEDGILLAEEISTLDLRGTELVVLSACNTGLGEITSEGVFGLQSAFKKAGVKTIIMSLWEVDDMATSLFMSTFYDEWFSGKTKYDAFKKAQRAVREYKYIDYSHPYYWAAFIMLD